MMLVSEADTKSAMSDDRSGRDLIGRTPLRSVQRLYRDHLC